MRMHADALDQNDRRPINRANEIKWKTLKNEENIMEKKFRNSGMRMRWIKLTEDQSTGQMKSNEKRWKMRNIFWEKKIPEFRNADAENWPTTNWKSEWIKNFFKKAGKMGKLKKKKNSGIPECGCVFTWSMMSIAVHSRRSRHEAQRRHVRHVRRQGIERSRVVRSSATRTATYPAAYATTAAPGHQLGVGAVTRTPPFAPVAVDGRLQLGRWTVFLLLTLVRVQILHIPIQKTKINIKINK